MKIGQFVKHHVIQIFSYCDNVNPQELSSLLDPKYSNKTFGINFPFCIDLDTIQPEDSKRYWKEIYMVRGKSVRVTSQWYQKNYPAFRNYLHSKGIQSEINVDSWDAPGDQAGNLRVVKTGRTVEEINAAARKGFRPLVKWIQPGDDIHQMVAVFQDRATGEIELSGDLRDQGRGEMVINYTTYYPYHFPNPFAAYLVPRDITLGEMVWLDDLIEDLVAVWGNQMNHPRLEAARAVWNGSSFDIQFDPQRDAERWIG